MLCQKIVLGGQAPARLETRVGFEALVRCLRAAGFENLVTRAHLRENLSIETSVIDAAHRASVKRLLGSSCIYPRGCPQPMKEESLLSGPLEPTNRPLCHRQDRGDRSVLGLQPPAPDALSGRHAH